MVDEEIYKFLTSVFRDVFMRDDIVLTSQTTSDDIEGWDSHKQIEILLATEEGLGIKFSSKEIDSLDNVGALAKLTATKLSSVN